MNLKYPIGLIAVLFLILSCKDDGGDTGDSTLTFADVNLVVRGTFDGVPFVQNTVYPFKDSASVRFSKFNFFVSALTAEVDTEETFSLDEVEYIDLAIFQDEVEALNGFTVDIGKAPLDEYTGFSFGIGLNPELNATTPDEYGQNHPMRPEDRYNVDFEGYNFLTIAGEVDYNSDNIFDESFNFVLGFDEHYETITSAKIVDILPGVTNVIELDIDLKRILDNGIVSIDFMNQLNTTADPSDEIMLILFNNIAGAISVK